MQQDGFTIREVSHNFTATPTVNDDITKGFVIGSRWILDNGDVYVCSDETASAAVWTLIIEGTVTSVGLTMPSAFTVSNSPITSNGDIAVTGAGLVSQYVRGDGSLANFPASTGGGASLSFYLNGSVSQGTFGGVAFKEMDRVPILGAGTDFTINTNGYIQSFITDANVPNLLEIPAGNWNFETYFSASSSGGSPSFYVELYKWNGTTLSLIASSSANPEGITNGTVTDLYLTALAVPQTPLLATDRLAIRIYVNNSGRTIKLHTENNHLCQVITTFSTGLTALNGLTDQVQKFAVGTSGTDFAISSATGTHTFNLPIASASNIGKLSSADWSTFNGKQDALVSGTNIKTINSNSLLGSGDILLGSTNFTETYIFTTARQTFTGFTGTLKTTSKLVPANTFKAGDRFEFLLAVRKPIASTNTNANTICANPTAVVAPLNDFARIDPAPASRWYNMERVTGVFLSATQLYVNAQATNVVELTSSNTLPTIITYDVTVDMYWEHFIQSVVSTDQFDLIQFYLKRIRL